MQVRAHTGRNGEPPRLVERLAFRVAIAIAGYALIAVVAVATMRRMDDFDAVTSMLPALCLFTAGIIALRARPLSPLPRLMQAAGLLALFWPTEAFAGSPLMYTVAIALSNAWVGPAAHFVLAFPSGRLGSAGARTAAGAVYTAVLPLSLVATLDFDPVSDCASCERSANLLYVGLPEWLAALETVLLTVLILACGVLVTTLLVRRWQVATAPGRRLLAPVVLSGAAGAVADFALNVALAVGEDGNVFPAIRAGIADAAALGGAVFSTTVLVMATGYLLGVLRTRVTRSTIGELVVVLGATTEPRRVRDPLARALGDDSLDVAFWAPRLEGYVDGEGRAVELPEADTRRAVTTVRSDGEPLAALIHDPAVLDDEGLVDVVAGAARLALERAQLQAQVRAQLEAVRESRARIVAAGDEQRKKIERDLHDGAQQRLVSLALRLKMLERRPDRNDDDAVAMLDEAIAESHAALEDLRDLAQGLHPQILTHEGLGPALESLAERSPVPVEVTATPEERLPEPVEACAYFVCSEALQNMAKYSRASRAEVSATRRNGRLELLIEDDGIGGADPAKGSGLRGLVDRVEAAGGGLRIESTPGRGTRIEASMPVEGAA